jgi:small conductance mechanosensitive channel
MLKIVALFVFLAMPMTAQAQAPIPAQPSSADASIESLVEILQNEQTRQALINRLQQAAQDGESIDGPTAADDLNLVQQLAQHTSRAAEGTAQTITSLSRIFRDIQRGLSNTDGTEAKAFLDVAANLVLVGVALFGSYLLLRFGMLRLEKQIAVRCEGRNWVRRFAGAFSAAAADALSVVLAWSCGYFVALFFVGAPSGRMETGQSLLLTAFLLVELSKVFIRLILAPRFRALRLVPVTDGNAGYWTFWLARMMSLIGYTFLFVSPLVSVNLDRGLAAAVQVVVMATATVIGVVIVLQNKNDVRSWLTELAARRHNNGYGQVLLLIGRLWHLAAIAYIICLLIAWFANPNGALPFMLSATAQSLVAVLIGVIISRFVGSAVGHGLHVPAEIKQRLPLLELRVQAFVPAVMQFVRWMVVVGVALAIAQAWHIFNFVGWIGTENGQSTAGAIFSAVLIVLIALAVHVAMSSWIEYRLNPNFGKVPSAREKTLLGLFKNAFTIALVVFGLMLALAQIGVNIAPLLAGAGVIGLAIGFGAQKLVEDIITGIFIQLENIMNEGDVVAVGDKSGVVEKLTIRSVTIRDLSGTVHLIPFSSVAQVSNMVRGFSFHVAEIGVAYDSDIDSVKAAMQDAFEQLMQTPHKDEILDELDMQGVIAFGDSAITVRARIKTLPGKHWGTGRAYSEILKRVFEERGIEIPYPHVTYVAASQRKGGDATLPPPIPVT